MPISENAFKEYKETKQKGLKDDLILAYAPLVKLVAGRLSLHIGSNVEYEDLVSYGILGLIDAIDKFDYAKGVKFETYASLRIRGAILDNIRKLDWVPRSLRQKSKQLEEAYRQFYAESFREPTTEELAEKLGLLPNEVNELIKKYSVATLISLDEYLEHNQELGFNQSYSSYEQSPEQSFLKKELTAALAEVIDKLTEKEKTVVTLYYYEDLTLKEISKVLGISESRVSQLHSKAVLKMQSKLIGYKSILFST